ncbi:MAG TPA: PLP-dependent aminotransferase family protein [Candidatus Limnocylindria bacterium]|nr:PLP-dependent aminotransferase family protein [Candidatus Limnocylindria bacterium]
MSVDVAASGAALASLRLGRDVHGSFIDETIAIVARQPRDIVSFAVGAPAAPALRLVGASELARAVLDAEDVGPLGYGITEGDPELRALIAAAARRDGIPAGAEDVIVTAGALQAIDLVCRVFIRPGDTVVVESPAFANALSAFRNAGARLLAARVDDEGLDVAEAERILERTGARPRAFFVVPNFQNPSGNTLSLRRRERLLALAERHGAVVIEDDPYGALRFRGEAVPPLGALGGAPVISIGTFSKVFVPGLRIGWAIADADTIRSMAAAKQALDSCTSTLGQRLAIAFEERLDEHVRALRAIYAEKQAAALGALSARFAGTGVRWNEPEGGFYLWVRLPDEVRARDLFEIALEEGVAFVPGDAFSLDGAHACALRFSYSSPDPAGIDLGVARLRLAFDRIQVR